MRILQRYSDSIKYRRPITITGLTLEGHVGGFTGVVQSVGHDVMRDRGSRYRITISTTSDLMKETGD